MSEIPHTLHEFEEGLANTKKSILLMASTASVNLKNAVIGLLERDSNLCNQAIADDDIVNTFERQIDEDGMEILMRFNPVATDLRSVIGSMKISTNLERISDLAEHIARRARKILKKPNQSETRLIEPLFQKAADLLDDAIQAYSEGDVELALTLFKRDEELDALHGKILKKLTRLMEQDTENLRTYLNLIFIVRCLERVGDHSVNIGEEAVYIHRAADIRHVGPSALEEE
ncbi:MAG: phosphate transport system regulatory protein PhoU [Verrucomicrobiales bacterium]|nr:phosphate transport system regulatory protein PhoU [Verrucomicrobiales bacterium]